ncbi:MAG TPA: hypothetical protein VMF59_12955 [Bacteroidota bacterium]|nr:hypothetical protein [Bacteroidota bacterium]
MEYRTGPEFSQAEAGEVLDFLRGRRLKKYALPPDRLHVVNDGREHFLRISNGKTGEYPVRGSFVFKLLKWYGFPSRQIGHLSIDTMSSVLNDYLVAIPGGEVNVTLEDGEAVSLTSNKYNELSDLEVLECAGRAGVACVSRNDYFMRVYSDTDYEVEPVPGDVCGIGYNVFNSETGFRSLAVRLFVRRYVCSNGAVIGRTEGEGTRVHYGHPDMELNRFLEETMNIGESLKAGVERLLEKSARLPCAPLVAGVSAQLKPLIGRRKTDELLDGLEEDATAYDLANRITSLAQSLDLRRRLLAESIGGELLAPAAELVGPAATEFAHSLTGE